MKVLDFGLARLAAGRAITTFGLALGTPSFMSPEQAAGRSEEIDGRTDLFALAATGFRICAGRRIHEATNPVDLVRKMASLAAPKVRTVRPEVSEACARVIDRALEFRREDRYESASAMRADVERAVAELEVRGPTQLAIPVVSAPPRLAPLESGSSGQQTTIEVSQRDLREVSPDLREVSQPAIEESIRIPRRRSALPWLALLIAGGGGAWWWSHHHGGLSADPGSTIAAASATAQPTPPVAAPSTSAQVPLVVRDRDAGMDAAAASAASSRDAGPAAKSSPSLGPSATHHGSPGKVGPGNVHKLPRKHHSAKAHPTQTQT